VHPRLVRRAPGLCGGSSPPLRRSAPVQRDPASLKRRRRAAGYETSPSSGVRRRPGCCAPIASVMVREEGRPIAAPRSGIGAPILHHVCA